MSQILPDDRRLIAEWSSTANTAKALLQLPAKQRSDVTMERWEELRLNLTVQRELALALRDRGTLDGRIAKAQLTELGGAPPAGQSELAWVEQKRAELNNRIMAEEAPSIAARDIAARNGVLIQDIDQILRLKRRQRLFSHNHPLLSGSTWRDAVGDIQAGEVMVAARPVLRQPYPELVGVPLPVRLALVAAIGIAATWVAGRCRRALRRAIDQRSTPMESPRSRLGLAFARDVLDIALPTGVLLVTFASIMLLAADRPFLTGLSGEVILDGLTVIFARWLGQSIFNPAFPPAQLVRLPDGRGETAVRLMTMLGMALAADQVVDYLDQQPGTSAAVGALASLLVVVVTAVLTWRLARILVNGTDTADQAGLTDAGARRLIDLVQPASRIMAVAAISGLVAALAGFVPLGRYLLTSTLMSLAVISTALFIYRSLTGASELLFRDRATAGSRYLQLLPLAFGFALFLLALVVVGLIWGLSAERIIDWVLALKNGVAVGQIKVSFGSVMTFAVVFLLGYALTRWLQRILHYAVLDRLRIEAGARAAVLTGFGYLGLTLSALVAITAAGLDLSSLAFVAGALSLGVGFGLQSVVANFVSGIILLIERPIKVGDWIELGGYSGHVRRVAFRSTHIETFDRHEVIIPNSDLISGSVTNLTYGGSMGRIILPVGVAYGSDVETARKVLLDVMTRNERVLDDPAPTVVMDSLGDSAINLQALCFVADVNQRLGVRSDLYFAILQELGRAGISIPFPQRELWVHADHRGVSQSPPPVGAAELS